MAKTKALKQLQPLPAWTDPLVAAVREHWAIFCVALVVSGLALLLLSLAGILPPKGMTALVGSYLALYGGIIALHRLPPELAGRPLRRALHGSVLKSGVGFYGVMTLARFLQLELHDLVDGLAALELSRTMLLGLLKDWLIGFSLQSLHNTIEAFLWATRLIGEYGLPLAGAVAAACWTLYAFGARAFPGLRAMLDSGRAKAAA
jgi:hypothetical protein